MTGSIYSRISIDEKDEQDDEEEEDNDDEDPTMNGFIDDEAEEDFTDDEAAGEIGARDGAAVGRCSIDAQSRTGFQKNDVLYDEEIRGLIHLKGMSV